MRAAVYLRISQDKTGEAAGVARQSEDCANLVTGQGWELFDTYVDNDISASSGKARPEYRRLLADIKAGHVDAVVAWHPDRLYRKLTDLEELIAAIEARNVVMRTVRAGEIDLSTPTGRMLARILSATAQAEGEIKSDRWKRSVRQRREQGRVPGSGTRMFGYTWDGEIVPAEAEVARWMARELVEGSNLSAIQRELKARGVETTRGNVNWSTATIRRYLTNPRLAGHSHLKGEIIAPGKWKPILDQETWETCRAILAANMGRPQTPRTLLVGLLYCGRCEGAMVSGARMNKRHETVRVYRCRRAINVPDNCGAVSGVAETIEEIVEAYARRRLADPAVRAAIRNLRAAPRAVVAEVTEADQRIQELEQTLDRPGVPVETVLRAIDRAKERREQLLASVATVRTPALPESDADWPTDQGKRRALIELVVERVTLEPATSPGLFDPERVKIKRR